MVLTGVAAEVERAIHSLEDQWFDSQLHPSACQSVFSSLTPCMAASAVYSWLKVEMCPFLVSESED